MTGNPYHEPLTAAAITHAGLNARISRANSRDLLGAVSGLEVSKPPDLTLARAIEIVLSRVKMHDGMRRDLMRALAMAREVAG